MSGFCKKCGDYILSDACNCKAYNILDDDFGEAVEVYAHCGEGAAKKHAENINEEGDLIGDHRAILVDGAAYTITAEPSVEYYARKLD